MDSEDSTRVKRKCISPIEAPKPDPTRLTDSNLQLSFETLHESNQDTSPTIEKHALYSHSDFAVDYHDCADDFYGHNDEEYEEEPSLDQTDSHMKTKEEHLEVDMEDYYDREPHTKDTQDEDTDKTEDHPQQDGQQETEDHPHDSDHCHEESSSPSNENTATLTHRESNPSPKEKKHKRCILQAYFFNKELAQKMNATEIREAINKRLNYNGNAVCSVLQLKYPVGGHFIYFHTSEGKFKLPSELWLLHDTKFNLEIPRKPIDRFCDCRDAEYVVNSPTNSTP